MMNKCSESNAVKRNICEKKRKLWTGIMQLEFIEFTEKFREVLRRQ